jgi:methyl-accepting chemotaxis protein
MIKIENEASKRFILDNIRFNTTRILTIYNNHNDSTVSVSDSSYDETYQTMQNNLKIFTGLELSAEEKVLSDEIKSSVDSLCNIVSSTFYKSESGRNRRYLDSKINFFANTSFDKIDSIYVIMFNNFSAEFPAVQKDRENTLRKIYIHSVSAVVIGTIVLLLTVYRISKPLKDLRKASELFLKGDYSYVPEYKTFDKVTEVSYLLDAFKKIGEKLKHQQSDNNIESRFTEK